MNGDLMEIYVPSSPIKMNSVLLGFNTSCFFFHPHLDGLKAICQFSDT